MVGPLPSGTIAAAKAGIAARQVEALRYLAAHPSPPLTCSGHPQAVACDWGRISQALILFDLNARAGSTIDVATANGYLEAALANLPHDAMWKGLATPDTMSGTPLTIPNDFFHFSVAQELSTILRGFGALRDGGREHLKGKPPPQPKLRLMDHSSLTMLTQQFPGID